MATDNKKNNIKWDNEDAVKKLIQDMLELSKKKWKEFAFSQSHLAHQGTYFVDEMVVSKDDVKQLVSHNLKDEYQKDDIIEAVTDYLHSELQFSFMK